MLLRTNMTQLILRSSSPGATVRTPTLRASSTVLDKTWNHHHRNASTATTGGGIFRPWTTPRVESNGDYRNETWLEEHIGGPLYQAQKTLPRLPVLTVRETLDRFVPTALPLARTEQEAAQLRAAVEQFPTQAAPLQERLLQRREEFHDSSWLQKWWNQLGYLQVRDTIVINVSYFFHLAKDPAVTNQIQRAAALLAASADFRKQVCSGQLPAEAVGKKDKQKALCSTAYKYMFHGTRIPAREQDSYVVYDPSVHHHAIVACRGHFFAMDFVDPKTGDSYPLSVLEAGLQQCRNMAEQMPAGTPLPEQFGWLTSQHRDDWADARKALVESSPKMQQALEVLQSGAIMICLDEAESTSRPAMAQLLLHAGRDASAGLNRWWDKSVQLVVCKDGQAGLVGEHSMMDGMPVVNFANRLTEMTYDKAAKLPTANANSCNVRPIFADALKDVQGNAATTTKFESLVTKAKRDLEEHVGRHELQVQFFHGYGSDFIKKAGFSPDAYVQMAMQLATYRLWGEQAGTYEATQVRPFLHGRTETARSVSTQSAAFVKQMGMQPKMDEHVAEIRKEKLRLLKEAVDAHVKYIGWAANAQGVDRHFLGLSMCVGPNEQAPTLYSDPVFQRAKRWRVSTSHLTHPRFENWGYGEVVPDGVGLAYSIHRRHCVFNLVALKELDWTEKLSDKLEEALLEMRTLVEMEATPTSKL